MAKLENNWYKTPKKLYSLISGQKLSGCALEIVMLICDKTYNGYSAIKGEYPEYAELSFEYISSATGYKKRGIVYALNELSTKGIIQVKQMCNKPNMYRLKI